MNAKTFVLHNLIWPSEEEDRRARGGWSLPGEMNRPGSQSQLSSDQLGDLDQVSTHP